MNKKIKAMLSMTMAFVLSAGIVGCGDKKDDSTPAPDVPAEIKVGGSVILGSTTELGGSDFGSTAWGNNAADADIRTLTNGYATVQLTSGGEYVWDETVVVKEHSITVNDDGTRTFKITINEGLKYSDGSDITAKDYIGYTLAMASPIVLDADIDAQGGTSYVGQKTFAQATEPTPFAGIRLHDEYTFSYTMEAHLFPYYYEDSYAAFSPYSTKLWLGEDVEIKDDGEGAYLSEEWYAKTTDPDSGEEVYAKAAQLEKARYATTERPCSGPYKFVNWNSSEKKCSLTINEYFQGNFEGQKPHIKDITYIKLSDDTMFDTFKSGGVDVMGGVSGGDSINAGLAEVEAAPDKYAYTNYLRAGYGKLQLMGDYGPTQFQAVRHALSHLLDKNEFASTYTGGYGSIVKGPYGLSSWMYQEAEDTLESSLNDYAFSVDKAIELLVADGWNYNADGTAYNGTGIRYKKLTAEEAAINGNADYTCGKTGVGTVKVGNDYYMPLALNWASTMPNPVTELLVIMLKEANTTAQAGMSINQEVIDFSILLEYMYRRGEYSAPYYSMFNLATGFTSPIYDYAGYWMTKYSYSNIVYAGLTPAEGATFTEADAALYTDEENAAIIATWRMYMGMGNTGWFADKEMDELTWSMVYEAETKEEYLADWVAYIQRWNEVLPEIALYSDLYHDFYNAKIGGYEVNPYWSTADAILYCYDKTAQ